MGCRVGMPVMKLDRQSHYGKKDSKSGNARAVANEALEERYSSDPDLNRNLTQYNQYWEAEDGETQEYFTSGNELADYWEELAENYTVTDKNGKQKKLRSDAGIGFAGICKPDADFMSALSPDEQMQFLSDSAEIIADMYKKRGMQIDAIVIHKDEGNPHLHYFGHDPQYQLGKKLGLPLYRALNETEYPERMRQLGWDVENLKGYDVEATKTMTADELTEYKAKHRAERKKSGKSSAEYKAEKEAKQILADAHAEASTVKKSLRAQEEAFKVETEKLRSERERVEFEQNRALQMQAHAKAQAEALEVERQRIRAEERAKAQAEAKAELERRDTERQRKWNEHFQAVNKTMVKNDQQQHSSDAVRKIMSQYGDE